VLAELGVRLTVLLNPGLESDLNYFRFCAQPMPRKQLASKH
jgi:hypothetical protein